MDTIEALKTRRSIRSYRPEPVPKEVIEEIVDCARLAPSAINVQPWEFVVVTDPAKRQKIAHLCDFGGFIAKAPVCIAVFCRDEDPFYLEDGAAATENILIAARAFGLGTCWIAGDKKDYVKPVATALGVPAEYALVSLIALGYSNEAPKRPKRPLTSVLHWECF